MDDEPVRYPQRLVALFALGCVLFSYPLLGVFARATFWLGVPATYLYLFGAWALLIVLMMLVVERRR